MFKKHFYRVAKSILNMRKFHADTLFFSQE